MYDRVEEAAAAIRSRCGALPETAIVLGSGLGDFADTLLDAIVTHGARQQLAHRLGIPAQLGKQHCGVLLRMP